MDWSYAIERNRDALKRVLAALVAMAGLAGEFRPTGAGPAAFGSSRPLDAFPPATGRTDFGQSPKPTSLPRHLHRAVLRLLRPAESAARRLVIAAARGLVVPPARPRAPKHSPAPPPERRSKGARFGAVTGIWMPPGLKPPASARPGAPERPSKGRKPCLPLFDRLPRLGVPTRPSPRGVPRLWAPGMGTSCLARPRPPLSPDDAIDAARLRDRLSALGRALDDLPGQARRYARWRMREANAAVAAEAQARRPANPERPSKGRRLWPLKPGRPLSVGRRAGSRPVHAVHEILLDAHHLALRALESPDTS